MRNLLYIYLIAVLFITGCGTAQNLISTPVQNTVFKNVNGSEVLLGHCSRSCLLQKPFSDWFKKNYNEYKVDISQVNELGKLMRHKNISIFLGTWCGDSKREVPRMLKILDAAGVKEKQISLVMLNNENGMYKQSPQHEEAGKNIFRVPTFIISEGKNEIGRIIESPKQSLEKDLMDILQKKNYTPNYSAGNSFFQKMNSAEIAQLAREKNNLSEGIKPRLKGRSELSSIGYVMMDSGAKEKAIFVFELNAELYPAEISVYNALAEGYLSVDDREKAKIALEKAKAIDAANTETVRLLKKLE